MDESEETHPFKCNFCTSKFSLMHEAQYHFVNFHQKKLEQTNIIEKRSSFEKKGSIVKQEPKPQQNEVDDDEIQEIELSGSYFLDGEGGPDRVRATQRPRIDLNKRFLPRPNTTTA